MTEHFEFKRLESLDEMAEMQTLEGHVWRMDGTPTLLSYTTTDNGGLCLGAYDGETLVAFSYGFPGFKNGQIFFYSYMLGVHQDYRHRGLGQKLKWRQRELAREMGYPLVTWTYDPLETANGALNLHKLRGMGARYYKNYYGDLSDGLNDGLPTDRFLVEWWVASNYLDQPPTWIKQLHPSSGPHSFQWSLDEAGHPTPEEPAILDLSDPDATVLVPVPLAFQSIKKSHPSLAISWRLATRSCFQELFKQNFTAIELLVDKAEEHVGYYVFVKRKKMAPYLTGTKGASHA